MTERDASGTRVDPDGVRVFERGRPPWGARMRFVVGVACAAAVVVLTAAVVMLLRREPDTRAAHGSAVSGDEEQRVAAQPAAVARSIRPVPISESASARGPSRGPAGPVSAGEGTGQTGAPPYAAVDEGPASGSAERERRLLERMANDVIEGLRASGETGGLAAFPPPGTNPIKSGLLVPEDFELPEGYVRYYQVTDDGRRLAPVLMFSPDYRFVGPDGKEIALPSDGIVPPDMAPPGMPLRTLEVPNPPRGAAGPR